MAQEKQSLMEVLYAQTFRDIKGGEIVKGKIIAVDAKEAIVDIGFKSEGFVSIEEFHDENKLQIGAEIDVLIESIEDEDGRLVLSHLKVEKLRGWMKMGEVIKEGDTVDGKVIKQVKGGFIVDVGGVEAFLPMSLSAFKGVSVNDIMAQRYKFQIAKLNKARRNLILSRREVVHKERELVRDKLWNELAKGQRRIGTVKGITDFGAFIDLGGVDGLLHITDMSWTRIGHPSELVKVGSRIEVLILDFDKENSKVSLGLKQILANPWDNVYAKYPTGTKTRGKVVNVMPYGVFIEIERGIEGLLHSSEITWQKKIVNPQEMFKVGDEIDVQIINVDKDSKRISLSTKQLEENPWLDAEKKYPIGTRIKGRVRGFTDYGAFVELDFGLEGMIHVSDMSWTRKINHPQDILQKGQEAQVSILAIDPVTRKINLGLKQLIENPWPEIAKKYSIDSEVDAQVVLNSNFGVFVKLDNEVEALVYSSEIEKEKAAALRPGDKLRVRIIKVDIEQMKIGVSAKI